LSYRHYTIKEDRYIRLSIKTKTVKQIAIDIDRTHGSVLNYVRRKGIRPKQKTNAKGGSYRATAIGTVSIWNRGGKLTKYVKTQNGWRALHCEVWKSHKGAAGAGNTIKFRDGDRMNCEFSNLAT